MIVYLDLILITNFVVNFVFLSLVDLLFCEKKKLFKTIFSSIVASLLVGSFILNYHLFLFIKVVGGMIISLLCYSVKDFKKFLLKVLSFYIINFFFIGLISSYKINKDYLLLVFLILTFILFVLQNNKKIYIIERMNSYNVEIYFSKYKIKVLGMFDSGNLSKYHNLPIIFINSKYYNDKLKIDGTTFIETVNGTSILHVFHPQRVVIDEKNYNCYVAFVDIKNTDCLLNLLIY